MSVVYWDKINPFFYFLSSCTFPIHSLSPLQSSLSHQQPFHLLNNPPYLLYNPLYLLYNPLYLLYNSLYFPLQPYLLYNPLYLLNNPSYLLYNALYLLYNPISCTTLSPLQPSLSPMQSSSSSWILDSKNISLIYSPFSRTLQRRGRFLMVWINPGLPGPWIRLN